MRLLLALVSGVVTLLLCELLAQLFLSDDLMNREQFNTFSYHVGEGYELIPNSEEEHTGYTVRINSFGYRDREFPKLKPAGTTRIVVVGDSVPFGSGVNVEATFPKQLEVKLKSGGRKNIEVINGGNPDTGLKELLRIFSKRDVAVSPDIALVCFYMNDSRPPMGFRSEFVGGSWVVRFVRGNPWVRRSMLVSFMYSQYYQWGVSREFKMLPISRRMEWHELFKKAPWQDNPAILNEMIETAQFDWGAAWRDDTWPEVKDHLKVLDRLCRQNNIRPALLAMPVKIQVYASVQRHEPQKALAKIAGELGWPYLDVLPGLIKAKDDPGLFTDHCHFSPRGHTIVSESIQEFLYQSGLLKRSVPSP
tara:strand:+ start:190 stop:1278 length:1089 start_codon:yes stop_codon:yes gene_type:complete